MSSAGTKIINMHTKGYLENEIRNIKHVIPSNKLKNIILRIKNNEIEIQEVSEEYGFSVQAFNILYINHCESLAKNNQDCQPTISKVKKKKNDIDQYYDTDSLIKNLQVSKTKQKIVITYFNGTRKIVDYTKENYRLYKQQIYTDGKNLVDTIEENTTKVKGVTKIKPSSREKLLYLKWHRYLLMKAINDMAMEYCKKHDSENYEVMKGIFLTYSKLNSLEYSQHDLDKDTEKVKEYFDRHNVQQYYDNERKKQSK